ncbi:MAG: hypothetical protein ACK559_24500, partial [bacterium]
MGPAAGVQLVEQHLVDVTAHALAAKIGDEAAEQTLGGDVLGAGDAEVAGGLEQLDRHAGPAENADNRVRRHEEGPAAQHVAVHLARVERARDEPLDLAVFDVHEAQEDRAVHERAVERGQEARAEQRPQAVAHGGVVQLRDAVGVAVLHRPDAIHHLGIDREGLHAGRGGDLGRDLDAGA